MFRKMAEEGCDIELANEILKCININSKVKMIEKRKEKETDVIALLPVEVPWALHVKSEGTPL